MNFTKHSPLQRKVFYLAQCNGFFVFKALNMGTSYELHLQGLTAVYR